MKYDYNRNIIAWVVLLITISSLYLIKPKIAIKPTIMLLPQTKYLPAINSDDVAVYPEISPLWAKTLLARISIKYPIDEKLSKQEVQRKALKLITENSANIGANAVVIQSMGASEWFYTKKEVLQIYALAYKI